MTVPVPDVLTGRPSGEELEAAGASGVVCSGVLKEVEATEVCKESGAETAEMCLESAITCSPESKRRMT